MGLEKNDVLKFTRTKEYLFEKFVGQGGTGKTALLKDEILNTFFICKKYEPSCGNDREDCFNRFIDEIKILYTLSHKNVVRIYNYYLYPQNATGFILMEYIDGNSLDEYLLWESAETFEKVFVQLIEGFDYLEKNSILHRDIKPQNILVNKEGMVKIIDFGFGKRLLTDNDKEASILLNWPVSEFPDEIKEMKYDHKTDIFFLGKMLNKLLEENEIEDFKYHHIIDKMIDTNPKKRISSFADILNLISSDILQLIKFTDFEKDIYGKFALALSNHLSKYDGEPKFEFNSDIVIEKLEKLLMESSLEKYIQDNSKLIGCFVLGVYSYYPNKNIEVDVIIEFYKLIKSKPNHLRNIIMNNIITRLKDIPIEVADELPF
ncbi:MAG TPA: serine/threonine protein kinase [Firmicutes bacterium]|jgi:eukaryotic-like serine/threonine-protein kinase|nr:serine/threonine protein kinase [Bacillota bacterium]